MKVEHGQVVFGQSEWYGCKLCYNTLYCRPQDIVKHMRKAHQEEFVQPDDYLINKVDQVNLPCQVCGDLNLLSKYCKNHINTSVGKKDSLVCPFCEECFSNVDIREAHVNIEHGKQMYADAEFECYQCNQCGVELYLGSKPFLKHMQQVHNDDDRSNLNKHIVKSLADIVTSCTVCKAPCLFSLFCMKHDAKIESVDCNSHPHHNCSQCDAAFTDCQTLWKHKFSVHVNERESLTCNLCSASVLIESPTALMYHWRQCHPTIFSEQDEHNVQCRFTNLNKDKYKVIEGDLVRYKCSDCDKLYSRFYELKCHLMIHRGERSVTCTICDKSFFQVSRLTEHYKRTHRMKVTRVNELKKQSEICIEGVTKYKCTMCPTITTRYDSLQLHMRLHTGERPFSCEVCGKTFGAREHLKRHFNNIHMKVGYQCNVCGRILTDSSNLKVHMRNHTGEKKYMCEVCGKGFSQWASHYYHKFTHQDRTFQCPLCGMTFRCPRTLTEHKKTHVMSEVKHVCETCGNEFNTRKNLLSHVKIHVAGRPHQCDVCLAKFKLRKYLIQHLKTHKPTTTTHSPHLMFEKPQD
uniref:Zinc finger protein 45 n=1 Tax=Cacopsylla melanoneura TaxID=428564 RepID=A0A8D8UHM2_9HEMI